MAKTPPGLYPHRQQDDDRNIISGSFDTMPPPPLQMSLIFEPHLRPFRTINRTVGFISGWVRLPD